MEFVTAKLDNGLEIIAECNDEAHSTAVGFFVETGARDESDDVSGVSHFLEHMMFKGTATRSAEDVNREFDEMGAHYNAFTSEESTVYYASVLPEFQGRSVELLGDMLRPALRDDDFNTEKQVILEEIKMYEDQPPFGADDKCPGRTATLASIRWEKACWAPPKASAACRSRRCASISRAAIARATSCWVPRAEIDFDALVRTARDKCAGSWKPADRSFPRQVMAPAKARTGFELLHKPTAAPRNMYCKWLRLFGHRRRPLRCKKLLTTMLGDDSGSRLYWELIDPGLAEHASLHHYDYLGAGVFLTYVSCDPPATAEEISAAMRERCIARPRPLASPPPS